MLLLLACPAPDQPPRSLPESVPVDSVSDSVSDSAESVFSEQLADADHVFLGESREGTGFNAADWFGWRVAGVGDVDGDGRPDLLMTGRYDDEGDEDAGKVYLVTATDISGGLSTNIAEVSSKWYGEGQDDHAGRDISPAGDIDGDGLADLFISSYYSGDAYQAGSAYVVLGASITPGSHPLAEADIIVRGEEEFEFVGRSIDGGEDLDGDGEDDLLVGSMGWDNQRGRVCQISGAALQSGPLGDVASSCALGEAVADNMGMDVAGVGDVDGDGLGDVLIGAWTYNGDELNQGRAYLSLGGLADGSAADLDYSWDGMEERASLGRAVAGAGDVDGDGLADFLVGAHGPFGSASSAGHTYLFYGAALPEPGTYDISAADLVFDGSAPNDYSGDALDSAGDVDGDGLDDLIFGALFTGDQGGTAYLWYAAGLGPTGTYSLDEADQLFHSETDGDRAGASVTGPGDIDGDGRDDLLIGAYGHDAERGAAYLVLAP
ncbi:MAG TPA: integrin alpha [Myxococcota bacterium]|nr:integrin alpha [Myxococcota bacterium]